LHPTVAVDPSKTRDKKASFFGKEKRRERTVAAGIFLVDIVLIWWELEREL
jgi:hypothetical protein